LDTDERPAPAVAAPRATPPASPPAGFAEFFRNNYKKLLRFAMYAGASEHQADEATAATMKELLNRWADINNPAAYARRAVISNLIKAKKRQSLEPIRDRLVDLRAAPAAAYDDLDLSAWEDKEWVMQLLVSLPPAQRDVMAHIIDGFTPKEIAQLLGTSPAAIRQCLHAAREKLKQTLRQEQMNDRPRAGLAGTEEGR
jgi:RNA polymerase sigma-70 factor (ECF subfamily)